MNHKFKWDPISAGRKAVSDTKIHIHIPPIIHIEKTIPPNNNNHDAYRNCSQCGKHYNYHHAGKTQHAGKTHHK